MAMGTGDMGGAPETTDAQEGFVERAVERVREFIAHPSRNADGTFTHRPDAELGFDPADFAPPADPAPVAEEPFGTPVEPVATAAVVVEEPVAPPVV